MLCKVCNVKTKFRRNVKTSLRAKPFRYEVCFPCIFIFRKIKLIFIQNVLHEDLSWNRDEWQIGKGLMSGHAFLDLSIPPVKSRKWHKRDAWAEGDQESR